MSSSVPDARPPRLRRRRMSAPPPRAAPPRLPPCRPLPLSLEALDLSPASPTQALASLRFLVLSYLADLERRLCQFESAEWASTALDMLHAIRADVRSHLPDLGAHLPDMDDLKSRFDFAALDFDFDFDFAGLDFLPDMPLGIAELKALVARQWADLDLTLDFSRPLSYVPTLAARLRRLHAHLHDSDLITTPKFEQLFDFDFDLKARAPARLAEVLEAFLAELPRLSSLPSLSLPPSLSSLSLPLEDADDEVARALARSQHGSTLIGYDDLPDAWRNNPYVLHGYRFIPLRRWDKLVASVAGMHNETLNIHTHLVPLVLWGAAYAGAVWPDTTSVDTRIDSVDNLAAPRVAHARRSEVYAVRSHRSDPAPAPRGAPAGRGALALFALACLASSALWHTMAGCAHRGTMETCARVDYVGIGWLIATSIATVVHHGYACAEAAVDATPLGHAVLHPGAALHSAGALLQEGARTRWAKCSARRSRYLETDDIPNTPTRVNSKMFRVALCAADAHEG
ncbi:hypothetical protein C8R43DRAFT_1140829 [Mycena crocata]|nr:hypothetical protein C8R43DRAFT_1140829 [Mycena crocata]